MSPAAAQAPPIAMAARDALHRCRVCSIVLGLDDDRANRLCLDCATRPEGKRLLAGAKVAAKPIAAAPAAAARPQPRPFTAADKSLIKNMAPYTPELELLRILNDRMHADLGTDAPPYTLEQLQAELATVQQEARAGDWASVRETLQVARRCGVLAEITPQIIDDFAVVFQLSSAQQMHLRDVIRSAKEAR